MKAFTTSLYYMVLEFLFGMQISIGYSLRISQKLHTDSANYFRRGVNLILTILV